MREKVTQSGSNTATRHQFDLPITIFNIPESFFLSEKKTRIDIHICIVQCCCYCFGEEKFPPSFPLIRTRNCFFAALLLFLRAACSKFGVFTRTFVKSIQSTDQITRQVFLPSLNEISVQKFNRATSFLVIFCLVFHF